ncbi:MAG: hypothetical protein EYC70_08900 [Planctomycetota bacterium]|nr:MAG: hypothetical protein EYC70_08900 [Planctomycetota bacterium]
MRIFEIFCFPLAAGLAAAFSTAAPAQDTNGDGYDELAVGVPFEEVNGDAYAGAANVLYGSLNGLGGTILDEIWHQDSPDIVGPSEPADHFGAAMAWGDFDGDGFADLAIGVPQEDVNGGAGNVSNAGGVHVLYGGPIWGLTSGSNFFFSRADAWVPRGLDKDEGFGSALAAGDFDDDGYDDLAVGIPYTDDLGTGAQNSGSIIVVRGGSQGLLQSGVKEWSQAGSIKDEPETDDRFGAVLAVGDFNEDGTDDLAITAQTEVRPPNVGYGAVHVLYGADGTGLQADGNQILTRYEVGFGIGAAGGELFGSSLAAGNFDGQGADELAIGSYAAMVGSVIRAGQVYEVPGAPDGLVRNATVAWSQDSAGIAGTAQPNDFFGYALCAGNFDADYTDDLAISAYGEDYGKGVVHVLEGRYQAGLTSSNSQLFWEDDIPGAHSTSNAHFGAALACGRYDNDGPSDLAIGTPGEDLPGLMDVGAVHVIYGTYGFGLGDDRETWFQSAADGQVEPGDQFGQVFGR